jgi:glycosyltransferase involved in cell wall biosynthesis
MRHKGPKISVIIPTYNRAAFLAAAVDSVRQQGCSPVEIIIVDDGSSDDTARLVRSLGANLRYVYQTNQGPAAARNRGLALAEGDFLAFLDTDDAWPGGRLHSMLRHLEQDDALQLVLGHIEMQQQRTSGEDFRLVAAGERVLLWCLGAALFRRSAFDRVGPFDANLRFSEDLDWYLKAMEFGLPMQVVPEIALHYRLHEDNMTRDRLAVRSSIFHALKRSLDRRRRCDTGRAAPLATIPGMEMDRSRKEKQ